MASIFQTPVALITLITEDRVWFKSKVGPFGACVTREGSWCNYISVPNTPEGAPPGGGHAGGAARQLCGPAMAGAGTGGSSAAAQLRSSRSPRPPTRPHLTPRLAPQC